MSQRGNDFEENILDATQAWQHIETDKAALAGLPEHALQAAKQEAEKRTEIAKQKSIIDETENVLMAAAQFPLSS